MSKLQAAQLFVIAGTVTALVALPVMANDISGDAGSSSTYVTTQTTTSTVQSLGVLHNSDMDNVPARQSAASQQDSVPTADEPVLQPVQQGDITYITGGIGDEERAELDAVKSTYNLHVTNAVKSGEFLGDAHIVIHNHQGQELVNASAGPVFFARLPKGVYTIDVISDGQKRSQQVKLDGKQPAALHFSWQ